ncbi:MAG TPA: ATP-binding protein [Leptospiraceae bacterium]|nr:ATP-binding protein [Leptospiraceae bacterium]HMW06285.1 ATP-binding protein [Leptospiraceae bacterium]HMY31747.1 ATP-binding protein [Leptospiraceae bacterium]HMZ64540.1 ATP-binding protein [Leptospiraceae bacterium]HNA06430.1 ATP-binding protein [Leptospiraceae bacterium]
MQTYPRKAEKSIVFALENFPVVAILGPRQSGKSTLAKEILGRFPNSIYLDLESTTDLARLQNPELFFESNANRLVCLDEIQHTPELFPVLRSIVDKNKKNAQILILGSASPELLKQSSESLAGRIAFEYLTPFTILEVSGQTDFKLEEHWWKGGFPLSYLKEDSGSNLWRENFLKTFIERDLFQFGIKTTSLQLTRFLTMMAHSNGQVVGKSKLAASLGVSHNTISHYIDIFEQTFFLRSLEPYFTNLKKRTVKSPKIYFRDSGVLHSMLKIESFNELLGHPICGSSWESYCIENIHAVYKGYELNYYRTSSGNEIDLILTKGQRKIAVEFKISTAPKVEKGFWISLQDLEIDEAFIICPIQDSYPIEKNVSVSGLKTFLEKY